MTFYEKRNNRIRQEFKKRVKKCDSVKTCFKLLSLENWGSDESPNYVSYYSIRRIVYNLK